MRSGRIGFELRSLTNMIRRHLVFSSHYSELEKVTGNNGWIIGYLFHNSDREIYQKDIEEHFTITRSTASKVLGLMERKGLIKRLPVDHDARLKRIVLTSKAHEIHEVMREDINQLEEILIKDFSPEETLDFLSYISRIKNNLSTYQKTSQGDTHD